MSAAARAGGILVVGDVIDDTVVIPSRPIRPDTDTVSTIRRVAGGSAANTAAWLAALGADVTFVGAVNRADVERHTALLPGVDVHLQPVDAATGAIIVIVQGAERSMLTDRGANAELDFGAIPDELMRAHVHLTGHSMAASDGTASARFLRRAKASGATVSVSPGSVAYIEALGAERFGEVIAGADVVFASLAEGAALAGAALAGAALAGAAEPTAIAARVQ
ncbi:PfkB family carbohydrate kinase, partial [Microbacterium sp.]|uniref:carbohydrate kinase family protein n=1 Tax=Microbacterium sp. TaxID=51671 RepID=UPI0025F4CD5C